MQWPRSVHDMTHRTRFLDTNLEFTFCAPAHCVSDMQAVWPNPMFAWHEDDEHEGEHLQGDGGPWYLSAQGEGGAEAAMIHGQRHHHSHSLHSSLHQQHSSQLLLEQAESTGSGMQVQVSEATATTDNDGRRTTVSTSAASSPPDITTTGGVRAAGSAAIDSSSARTAAASSHRRNQDYGNMSSSATHSTQSSGTVASAWMQQEQREHTLSATAAPWVLPDALHPSSPHNRSARSIAAGSANVHGSHEQAASDMTSKASHQGMVSSQSMAAQGVMSSASAVTVGGVASSPPTSPGANHASKSTSSSSPASREESADPEGPHRTAQAEALSSVVSSSGGNRVSAANAASARSVLGAILALQKSPRSTTAMSKAPSSGGRDRGSNGRDDGNGSSSSVASGRSQTRAASGVATGRPAARGLQSAAATATTTTQVRASKTATALASAASTSHHHGEEVKEEPLSMGGSQRQQQTVFTAAHNTGTRPAAQWPQAMARESQDLSGFGSLDLDLDLDLDSRRTATTTATQARAFQQQGHAQAQANKESMNGDVGAAHHVAVEPAAMGRGITAAAVAANVSHNGVTTFATTRDSTTITAANLAAAGASWQQAQRESNATLITTRMPRATDAPVSDAAGGVVAAGTLPHRSRHANPAAMAAADSAAARVANLTAARAAARAVAPHPILGDAWAVTGGATSPRSGSKVMSGVWAQEHYGQLMRNLSRAQALRPAAPGNDGAAGSNVAAASVAAPASFMSPPGSPPAAQHRGSTANNTATPPAAQKVSSGPGAEALGSMALVPQQQQQQKGMRHTVGTARLSSSLLAPQTPPATATTATGTVSAPNVRHISFAVSTAPVAAATAGRASAPAAVSAAPPAAAQPKKTAGATARSNAAELLAKLQAINKATQAVLLKPSGTPLH